MMSFTNFNLYLAPNVCFIYTLHTQKISANKDDISKWYNRVTDELIIRIIEGVIIMIKSRLETKKLNFLWYRIVLYNENEPMINNSY